MSTIVQEIPEAVQPSSALTKQQPVILRMFSRRWILATFLVIAAMAVMVRLGIWQLDRLEQRRAFNARVLAQVNQPPLLLTDQALNADLAGMEYRPVIVEGEYDHSQEVALRNQAWNDQIGVHLLTPLKIAGSDRAVLVDRGWVPVQDFNSHDWSQYTEPGKVRVQGVIRDSSSKPDFGKRNDPPGRLDIWNFANVGRIAEQVSYPLLPIYIQQAPDPAWTGLPHRSQPELDLTEGPHLGYAFQWFTFAAILGLGYPFFIRRQEKARLRKMEQPHVDHPITR
jgi:surfeit locus 1 family protein